MKSFRQQEDEIRTRINRACYGSPYVDYLNAWEAFFDYASLLERGMNYPMMVICDDIAEGYFKRAQALAGRDK